jgi:hypothetical protein
MNFNADKVGRHMLYFVVNNQPSNVVVVDVFAQASPENATAMIDPATNQTSATADMPKPAGNTLVTTPSIAAFLGDDGTTSTQLETSSGAYKQRQMN